MHTEQNQINLSSRVKSLSFCFLLTIQMTNITFRKIRIYKDIAKEKSTLIIRSRQVYLYCLPFIRGESSLLYKKIAADIAHTQKIRF